MIISRTSDKYKNHLEIENGALNVIADPFNIEVLASADTKLLSPDATGDIVALETEVVTTIINSRGLSDLELMGTTIIKGMNVGASITSSNDVYNIYDGYVFYTAVYLPEAGIITGVKIGMHTQGDYTADNYNGVGLYSESDGTLTLVASSVDDGDIWKAAGHTLITKAFSSSYNAAAGLYYVAYLYNNSAQTTAPKVNIIQINNSYFSSLDFSDNKKLCAYHTAQTALPVSVAMTDLTQSSNIPFFLLYK